MENEKRNDEARGMGSPNDDPRETSVLVAVPYRQFCRQSASRVVRLAFCSFERPPIDRRRSPWPEGSSPDHSFPGGPLLRDIGPVQPDTRFKTFAMVESNEQRNRFAVYHISYIRFGCLILDRVVSVMRFNGSREIGLSFFREFFFFLFFFSL